MDSYIFNILSLFSITLFIVLSISLLEKNFLKHSADFNIQSAIFFNESFLLKKIIAEISPIVSLIIKEPL